MIPLPESVRMLEKKHHQLFIRLPRLIAYMRDIRQQTQRGKISPRKLRDTQQLANDLLDVLDKQLEAKFSRRLVVKENPNKSDRRIVPYSYTFKSSDEANDAVQYWNAGIMLLRIWLRLDAISRHLRRPDGSRDHIPGIFVPEEAKLRWLNDELSRMATNVVMSLGYDVESGQSPSDMPCPLIPVWGVIDDGYSFPNISEPESRALML